MAQRCEICGKGPLYGHAVSHSKHAVNRRFMPNLTKRTLEHEGRVQKIKVCNNCLRTRSKAR
ncbi:MAG: 50S ribosomal protein L28 [Chloroflexi bacterium]|nr:50S ribosomal protein L28 [Chloroflexota bacterium]